MAEDEQSWGKLDLTVLSISNLRRSAGSTVSIVTSSSPSPSNGIQMWCSVSLDGKDTGMATVHYSCPRPLSEGSGVSVNFSHNFHLSVSAKTQKASVLVYQKNGEDGAEVFVGQMDLQLASLELGKQEVKTQPLRNKNKKMLSSAELVFMCTLSRKISVTGPTSVCKPTQESMSGILSLGRSTERGEPSEDDLSPRRSLTKKQLQKVNSKYMGKEKKDNKSSAVKFFSKKNSRKASTYVARPLEVSLEGVRQLVFYSFFLYFYMHFYMHLLSSFLPFPYYCCVQYNVLLNMCSCQSHVDYIPSLLLF